MLPVKPTQPDVVRTTDEIREWILGEIAAALNTDAASVDPAAQLTSLGVDSLVAFTLTGELASWLGRDLPATLLWDYPTIDAIAEGFGGDPSTAPPDATPEGVVLFRDSGEKRPIFFTPGIGGHPVSFGPVVERLGDDQPCYGLTVRGFEGDTEPLTTVDQIAEYMVANMRRVQPEGPYRIVGYSFGGYLAYEMARRLVEAGQRVSLLAVLDTFTPDGSKPRPKWQRLALHVWVLITRSGRIDYLRSRLSRHAAPEPVEAELPAAPENIPRERVRKIVATNHATLDDYQPGAYTGDVLALRASKRPWHSAFLSMKDDLGWSSVTSGRVDVVDIPGAHNKMLDDQSGPIVDALRPYLENN